MEGKLMKQSGSHSENSLIPRRKMVWILDDDLDHNAAWSGVLRASGYEVVAHDDVVEGMAWFGTHFNAVDLCLMDVMMPGLDGEECLATVRLMRRDLPVIVATAYASSEVIEGMRQKGISGVLRKPFMVSDCLDHLVRALYRDQ
jgi:CheY-like chemotaxis protein